MAIEYQQTLRLVNGALSLRFPIAITPRYIPGTPLPMPVRRRLGRGHRRRGRRVPDHAAVVHPSAREDESGHADDGHRRRRPARQSRQPLPRREGVEATRPPLHADARRPGAGRPRLRGHLGARAGQRAVGRGVRRDARRPRLRAGHAHALAARAGHAPPSARGHVRHRHVGLDGRHLDRAGEGGTGPRAGPAAAWRSLQRRSSSTATRGRSSPTPMPVDPATLGRARVRSWCAPGRRRHRDAQGAHARARRRAKSAPGLVRQVVFLTDGAVGNEDELFQLIRERLGDRRLFTVGIGSAPNAPLHAQGRRSSAAARTRHRRRQRGAGAGWASCSASSKARCSPTSRSTGRRAAKPGRAECPTSTPASRSSRPLRLAGSTARSSCAARFAGRPWSRLAAALRGRRPRRRRTRCGRARRSTRSRMRRSRAPIRTTSAREIVQASRSRITSSAATRASSPST